MTTFRTMSAHLHPAPHAPIHHNTPLFTLPTLSPCRPLPARWARSFAALLGVVFCLAASAETQAPLPGLAAQPEITVSGISSGGFMAVQLHVAHSSLVKGVGVLAGGPYYCAEGSAQRAVQNCMAPSAWRPLPEAEQTLALVRQLAQRELIDSEAHLATDRAWLFSGANDETVSPQAVDTLETFYGRLLPAGAVRHVRHPEAGHAMISAVDNPATPGNPCPSSRSPYINDCGGFDAPGALLNHLLAPETPLNPPVSTPLAPAHGTLSAFSQARYTPQAPVDLSMAQEGYVYVPDICQKESCHIHVALHGCQQNTASIGQQFIEDAGYNHWAASNRIIVLYPQTIARQGFSLAPWSLQWVMNPNGCWDWWGYADSNYHTRKGQQIQAIHAMIQQLQAPRTESGQQGEQHSGQKN